MLKKIIATTAIFAATASIAFADATPYVGAELGGDWGSITLKDAKGVNHTYSPSGALGGFFVGIGGDVTTYFHLGGELFANWSTDSSQNKVINTASGTSTAKVSAHYTYGLSLLPGFHLAPKMMAFLRLGVIRGRFNLNQSSPPASATSTSSTNTRTGSEIGIGLQTTLNKDWDLRGEYDYVSYRSYSAFGNQISARNNIVKVGIIYNIS